MVLASELKPGAWLFWSSDAVRWAHGHRNRWLVLRLFGKLARSYHSVLPVTNRADSSLILRHLGGLSP